MSNRCFLEPCQTLTSHHHGRFAAPFFDLYSHQLPRVSAPLPSCPCYGLCQVLGLGERKLIAERFCLAGCSASILQHQVCRLYTALFCLCHLFQNVPSFNHFEDYCTTGTSESPHFACSCGVAHPPCFYVSRQMAKSSQQNLHFNCWVHFKRTSISQVRELKSLY